MSTRNELGKSYGKSLIFGSLGLVLGVAVGHGLYSLDKSDKAKDQRQDAELEQAIQPTAEKIARYAIKHATEKPYEYDGKYQFVLGDIGDGKTTILASVRKVEGQAPSANDVTMVMVTDWKAPGGEFGDVGPYYDQALTLHDTTWVASARFDQEAPYDNALNLSESYTSAEQPYIDSEQNLDTAESVVSSIESHFHSAKLR